MRLVCRIALSLSRSSELSVALRLLSLKFLDGRREWIGLRSVWLKLLLLFGVCKLFCARAIVELCEPGHGGGGVDGSNSCPIKNSMFMLR